MARATAFLAAAAWRSRAMPCIASKRISSRTTCVRSASCEVWDSTGRLFAKVPEDRRTMARSRALGVDGGRLETASRRGGTSSKTESAPHTIMSAERIDSGGWVWPSATNPLRPHLRPVRAEPLVVCGCTSAAAVARHRHSSLKPSGPARYRPGKTPSRSRGPKVMCHDYLTAFHLPLEPPLSRWTSQGRVLA